MTHAALIIGAVVIAFFAMGAAMCAEEDKSNRRAGAAWCMFSVLALLLALFLAYIAGGIE